MDTWKEDKAVLRGEIATRIPHTCRPACQASLWFDFSDVCRQQQLCEEAGQHPGILQRITCYLGVFLFLFFIIIVIIIPLSVSKLIVNVRKPVLLWTTLYQSHPVTFLWRQLWRGWHLTPCWQRHREADLKKTIDAFSRTPLPSLSLRYIFSEIYLVTRPPDTIGYPAQQGNEWRALPEPAKYPGFYNVLVFPLVWEWIVGTVLNIKHRT